MINNHSSERLALCTVLLVAVLLAGCSASPSSPAETPLPVTSTRSPCPVPCPTPELATVAPSPSRVPPTRAPIPTRTPPPPTLTAEEERAYVRQMLETNGGCELPCWWGVTPGKTSWQGMTYFLVLSPEGFRDYAILHTLSEANDIVQRIEVQGCLDKVEGSINQFTQDWARYSLDQVLSRYGVPSRARIALALPVEPGGPTYYILYVFYDNLGIGIRYLGPASEQGELLRTCFSFEDITLWLQSPESSTPLEHAIGPDEWSFAVPLDEATGMSVEEFYETFRQPGACLEAPPTFQ